MVDVPFLEVDLNVVSVFFLLGVEETEKMLFFICGNFDQCPESILDLARSIIEKDADVLKSGLIEDHVRRKGTRESSVADQDRYVKHIFCNEVLPHVGLDGSEHTKLKKARIFGYMINKLLAVHLNLVPFDDRDHYSNKRLECPGYLCSLMFRQLFRTFLKTLTQNVKKKISATGSFNLRDVVADKRISAQIRYAMATGNWGAAKSGGQQGVVQVLSRNSKMATLSNLRRDSTPINKDSKSTKPRELHPSGFGVNCPTETPEGSACGLVGALAICTHIRTSVPGKKLIPARS